MQEDEEGVHVVGPATLPDMSKREYTAAPAIPSTQTGGKLATRTQPDVLRISNRVVAQANVTPLNLRGPSATKGKRAVDFFPEELPELRRYVNLPDVRQVVKDIHPPG